MNGRAHETKPIDPFLQCLRDTLRRMRKTVREAFSAKRGYYAAVTFVICQHRGLLIGLHDWSVLRDGRKRESESERHDPYLFDRPFPSYAYGISLGIPAGPYRNTQSICMLAHTYVEHVIHGIIHATNPRYQKIPPGLYTRTASVVCSHVRIRVTVIHDGTTHVRFMVTWKWRLGIM